MNTEQQIEHERQQLISEDVSKFPSMFQQARNLAKQAWVSSTASLLHGKPFLATPEKAYARLQICQSCEFYIDSRCLHCGCFMDKKTQLDASTCPASKWGPELQQDETKKQPGTQATTTRPSMRTIDLNTYSEFDRNEITRLSEESLSQYDGRFVYNGVHYLARTLRTPNITKTAIYQLVPKSQRYGIVDHLSPSERSEFNTLARTVLTQANNSPTVFTFKDTQFRVLPMSGSSTGIRIELVSEPTSPAVSS